MSKIADFSGKRVGKLTVIEPTGEKSKYGNNIIWLCLCDCGNYTTANSGQLRVEGKKSCGCLPKERMSTLNKTHGGRHDRLYLVWMDMRRRCRDPKDKNYVNYGGRGVSVCDAWQDYSVFREWAIRNGYQETARKGNCTLDRVDVNGNYSPENCRWIDMKAQANNKRNNVFIAYNGKTQTTAQWSRECGFNYNLVWKRISCGWSIERAITTPPRVTKRTMKANDFEFVKT